MHRHNLTDMITLPDTIRMLLNLIRVADFRDISEVAGLYFRRLTVSPRYRPVLFHAPLAAGEVLHFEDSEKPVVSIVIPTHNQWDYTCSALRSILHNTTGVPYEVVVADDVSTDATVEICKVITGITVVRNETNLGFLRNCNNAAKLARGKYILFLNNDTNVQKGWLDMLLRLIEGDPAIGMVGPKLVYPDGRLQEAGGIVWNDATGWNYGRWDDPDDPRYNFPRETDYISGACIMIRKELWDEIGGFDERYAPAYSEDSDLAFEVRKRGCKVVYQPESVVVHFEGTTCGTDTGKGVKKYQEINQGKFFRKWEEVLKREHFLPGQLRLAVRERYEKSRG